MEMKTKKIPIPIEYKDFCAQKVIQIQLNSTNSKELCMMFLLLKEKLVRLIELKFNEFNIYLQIQKGNQSEYDLFNKAQDILKGRIAPNDLDYILSFLLKYYRDEVGEADHIDVDFKNTVGEEITLTFKCDRFEEYNLKK
jgi:hypothetical protein